LSENRSAGVITFDSTAQVRIHLNVDSTSDFSEEVDKIGYSNGGTDILTALQVTIEEINSYSKHSLTVVGEYPTYHKSAVDSVTYVKGKHFV
jgi:uncharacterized protein with von Willebrand factor type A (vWA) domain